MKTSITFELLDTKNKELQLMDLLDQVMEEYHGIGKGIPEVDGKETARALSRMMEKWMPTISTSHRG